NRIGRAGSQWLRGGGSTVGQLRAGPSDAAVRREISSFSEGTVPLLSAKFPKLGGETPDGDVIQSLEHRCTTYSDWLSALASGSMSYVGHTSDRWTCMPVRAPSPTASETVCGVRATSPQAKTPGTDVCFDSSVRSWMPIGVSSSSQPIASGSGLDGTVRVPMNRPLKEIRRPSDNST